jgi:hypothetical protein
MRSRVRKPSTTAAAVAVGPILTIGDRRHPTVDCSPDGGEMGMIVFALLTLAVFGLLGLVQKLVERL